MVKQKSVKGNKDQPDDPVYKMDKFFGEGIMFKCKLFGSLKVPGPRGDVVCAEAIAQLKQHAKQLNKEQKLHKQRIFLNISLKGIRIIDQQSKKLEHAHVVHKISYISHDKEDRRTFGYIVSLPEGYHLFAFRAEKNAGVITSNLKELFHVVYLKHKHDIEQQGKSEGNAEENNTQSQDISEGGTELVETKSENPYSVPMKFQLFEESRDSETSYSVPSGVPAFDSEQPSTEEQEATNNDANLLDWTDVNEELEILQKDLKRSDTRQLLAELGDFDLENNPPLQPDGQNIFSDDPFFKPSTSSANEFFDGMTAAFSQTTPDQSTKPDPFLPVSDSFSTNTGNSASTEVSSNNFNFFDTGNAFASTQQETKQTGSQPVLSGVSDVFNNNQAAQSQASAQFASDWSTSFAGNGSGQHFPALNPTTNENSLFSAIDQPPSVELQPEKLSETSKSKEDPFDVLSGDISDIRGTLRTATGANVPQFPKKKPASPLESTRVVSPGPSLQPSALIQPPQGQISTPGVGQQIFPSTTQSGFAQNNPFNQPTAPYNTGGYSTRMNAPPVPSRPDIPPIPARQDILFGGNFQPMQQPIQQQQQYAPPIPKPYSQSHNMQAGISYSNTTSPNPPLQSADPFAGLGGAFSTNQSTATPEPLYAVVDKSYKTKQDSSDMLGFFNSSKPLNGNGGTPVSTGNSDQDPFGFGL